MSQFSTGELAKAAEVSVRTVQYYDQRGILTPSEVTEGGRRIYHESDLERLQVICFLRDLDFSINQIKKLLQEENREQVLELLLTDQIESLEKSSEEIEVKLKRARHLQKQLLSGVNFRWKICQTFHVLWKIKNHGVICS
mgnify:CR=1 FL=1